MPEPMPQPDASTARRTAWVILGAGILITVAKFTLFGLTDSVAVLSDAAESVVNIAAAGAVMFSLWLSNQPVDRSHPYGHGKVEFFSVGLEAALILIAAVVIAFEAVARLISAAPVRRVTLGIVGVVIVAVATVALAWFVLAAGRRLDNAVLRADGKHLLTDAGSTLGVLVGLILARLTGWGWIDPVVALLIAGMILVTGWRLGIESIHGLMDRIDPKDEATIVDILDQAIASGEVLAYHKVRHRHTGAFHWVDMHLGMQGDMSVEEAHRRASVIENRIEQALGQANATTHIEPFQPDAPPPPGDLPASTHEPTSEKAISDKR